MLIRSDKRASNMNYMSLEIESLIKVTLVIELSFRCIILFYMIYVGLTNTIIIVGYFDTRLIIKHKKT